MTTCDGNNNGDGGGKETVDKRRTLIATSQFCVDID